MIDKNTRYIITDPYVDEFTGNNIDMAHPPKVSFCIPTFNNENTIYNCLQSIVEQKYPDIEIIIIDGHSTDQTIEIASKFTKKIYYDDLNYGSACQTGLRRSNGLILALFDSDIVIPHEKWLFNAVKYFNYGDRVSSVWPIYIAPPNSSLFQKLYQTNIYKILITDRITKNRGLFGGGNTLFLKECIEQVGGIDSTLHWGADFDWAQKLKDNGYQVVFISDPLYHDTMRSLREFAKKQFTGARTFTSRGFALMGLTTKDVIYEHFVLGTKGMIKGLAVDRDISWLLFPIFLVIRSFAYAYIFLKKSLKF